MQDLSSSGHYAADPAGYRTAEYMEEAHKMTAFCYEKSTLERKVATEKELETIEEESKQEIAGALNLLKNPLIRILAKPLLKSMALIRKGVAR